VLNSWVFCTRANTSYTNFTTRMPFFSHYQVYAFNKLNKYLFLISPVGIRFLRPGPVNSCPFFARRADIIPLRIKKINRKAVSSRQSTGDSKEEKGQEHGTEKSTGNCGK